MVFETTLSKSVLGIHYSGGLKPLLLTMKQEDNPSVHQSAEQCPFSRLKAEIEKGLIKMAVLNFF